jgi:hypothetical protein
MWPGELNASDREKYQVSLHVIEHFRIRQEIDQLAILDLLLSDCYFSLSSSRQNVSRPAMFERQGWYRYINHFRVEYHGSVGYQGLLRTIAEGSTTCTFTTPPKPAI